MGIFDEAAMPPPGVISYQLGLLDKFRERTEEWRRDVDEDRVLLKAMREDLRTLKRIGVGLLISVVTGSASITIAVLLSTGKL